MVYYPQCKQEAEAEEQGTDALQKCPHCGKNMNARKGNATSPIPNPSSIRISLVLDVIILLIAIILGALVYFVPAYYLYLWKNQIYACAFVGISCGAIGIYYGHKTCLAVRDRIKLSLLSSISLGLLSCYIGVLLIVEFTILILILNVNQSRGCENNQKQLGLECLIYASRHPHFMLPELSSQKNVLMFDMGSIYPDLIKDPRILICPADYENNMALTNLSERFISNVFDPEKYNPKMFFQHSSYCYLGYEISNDKEMYTFVQAYKERIVRGLPFDTDLDVAPGTGTDGEDKILRLRYLAGILVPFNQEDLMKGEKKAKAMSKKPVMWDRCSLAPDQKEPVLRHMNRGIRVLFLDGHSEYIRYGECRWPLTEETLRLFWELENL